MLAIFSIFFYTGTPGTLVFPPESTAMVLYDWKDSEASHRLQDEMEPFFSPVAPYCHIRPKLPLFLASKLNIILNICQAGLPVFLLLFFLFLLYKQIAYLYDTCTLSETLRKLSGVC